METLIFLFFCIALIYVGVLLNVILKFMEEDESSKKQKNDRQNFRSRRDTETCPEREG